MPQSHPADRHVSRDPHQPLRDDVRLLGELLGQVLTEHADPGVFERVEQVRALAKRAHVGAGADSTDAVPAGVDAEGDFDALADLLRGMPIALALPVARAFAHFLNLANIAEQQHRVRRRRQYARRPQGDPQRGSCADVFARLRRRGISADAMIAAVRSTRIELILTSHPTEISRRTLIQTYDRIAEILAFRDRPDLTPGEREESVAALHREVATAWQTDEVRRHRVSPLDEVRAGLIVFEQSLWHAVPKYLRAVDAALLAETGTTLPLDFTPIRFGSWIGGDRDGNPTITPEVTRRATWLARWMAADLYSREVVALRSELSLTGASDELRLRVGDVAEPYRVLLAEVRDRLIATREWATSALDGASVSPPAALPYTEAAQLREALDLCFRSLAATGNALIAAGRLTDLLRRVTAFGITLARLDLRQEASRHTEAVDWICQARRLGAYAAAPEVERQRLLVSELTAPRVGLRDLPIDTANERVRDVLETFRVAAELPSESLGAYVITMASQPSDVLAVEFLQTVAGTPAPQRVVPLFETAADLRRAGTVTAALLDTPWYRDRIDGRQEVMLGYSDSAKDAGRFSAAWALYRAQEDIIAACDQRGVHLTVFHGRGGSIGRGGGPTNLAIQSQPPGSTPSSLRVTEQGEMVQAKFGLVDIAVRTLEVYTTATLERALVPAPRVEDDWRRCMEQLSTRSREAYRSVVYDDPQFIPYFRAATPESELGLINIGSRPARRSTGGGVETLRAIPWQFAWTQTRLLLPSWLGLEDALDDALARGEGELVTEMYARWPFFRSTLDLIEMVLAKADGRIAAQYDRLVPEPLKPLGDELRRRLARATGLVRIVTGHRILLETNPVLRRSIDLRNPYVDPINLVQVELLRRMRGLRAADPAESTLRDAFAVTVNGIAAGMRNTG